MGCLFQISYNQSQNVMQIENYTNKSKSISLMVYRFRLTSPLSNCLLCFLNALLSLTITGHFCYCFHGHSISTGTIVSTNSVDTESLASTIVSHTLVLILTYHRILQSAYISFRFQVFPV